MKFASYALANGLGDATEVEEMPAMSSPRFQVRVTKDYLVFCSGHFITYQGDQCERIHGHNYRTAVEVEGDLDENHYVIDFIVLKDLTKSIIDELDHRMMLPTRNRHIRLQEEGPNIRVTYRDRYWSFPREECALVPIANTTAELLADYIARRLREAMSQKGWAPPRALRVEVEESFGQSARVEWRSNDSAGSS
jgi:6-pyruvoyltetrahydropterin/6-carboxytetrahydropterin synthase